jgi:RHS repeat-associated protein
VRITTNSFAYTGREIEASNLYYYRARYYNPALQRFISEDPIGFFGGGPNFYAYVNNNPNLFTDPTGFCLRPPTPEEYDACMIRATATRDNAISNARGVQLVGGLLTLAGTAVAWYSLPTLGETFFNDGLACLFDFAHAGGFAYFGAAGPLAAGIGIFGKGTYDVANAWDQYYANSIPCAAAVSSNP